MSDIVQRLRKLNTDLGWEILDLGWKASDEIERLRAELAARAAPCHIDGCQYDALDRLNAEIARLREALIAAEEAVRRYVPLLRPHDTGVVLQKIMTEAADRVATIARAALAEQEKP